jgi:Domain of unknown function (DUF4279)
MTIRSADLTSNFISQHLALEPEYSYDVGDPVSPKRYPRGPFRKEAFWSRGSGLPDGAPLAAHLQTLIDLLDSRREALRSIRNISKQRFFCGLFGDYEMTAVFEIPAHIIKWCSEVLDVVLDCFPCIDNIDFATAEVGDVEISDDEVAEPAQDQIEADRSFSYLTSAYVGQVAIAWPHQTNDAPSDQLLPRPRAAPAIAVTSDLPESAEALQHLQRVLYLLTIEHNGTIPIDSKLVCLFSTDRGAGSFVRLEIPILRQLAELGSSFRMELYQTLSVLRRLRQFS